MGRSRVGISPDALGGGVGVIEEEGGVEVGGLRLGGRAKLEPMVVLRVDWLCHRIVEGEGGLSLEQVLEVDELVELILVDEDVLLVG